MDGLTRQVKQLRERFDKNAEEYKNAEPIKIEDPWTCKEVCATHSLPCRSRHEALVQVELRGWSRHPQVMVRMEEHVCIPPTGEPHPWLKKPEAPAPSTPEPQPAAPATPPAGAKL